MISCKLQIAILIAVGIYFFVVFQLLKNKTLNVKYTLLWIISGGIMLLLAIFPQLLVWFADLVGIYAPTNALFAFMFFSIIIILMSITAIVSTLNEKCKQLIQSVALLEKRMRKLEKNEDISK